MEPQTLAIAIGRVATYAGDLKDEEKDPLLNDIAWYVGNSYDKLPAVGQKQANAWGLHDMLGTVWEWCADAFGPYPNGPVTEPVGDGSVGNRVVRGGSGGSIARFTRSACRGRSQPGLRGSGVGFRFARGRPAE